MGDSVSLMCFAADSTEFAAIWRDGMLFILNVIERHPPNKSRQQIENHDHYEG